MMDLVELFNKFPQLPQAVQEVILKELTKITYPEPKAFVFPRLDDDDDAAPSLLFGNH